MARGKGRGGQSAAQAIPYGKIGFTVLGLAIGTAIAYNLGIFTKKTKPKKCQKNKLSIFTNSDGSQFQFAPDKFVSNLHADLEGLTLKPSAGTKYYMMLAESLSENDMRCAHNTWLKLINSEESLYSFISSQIPFGGSQDATWQPLALAAMSKAGLKT